MSRSSHRWQSKPGNWDALNTEQLFAGDNELGIPCLAHTPLARIPRWLVAYRTRIRGQEDLTDGAIHFFLDDYRFETVWNRPRKALVALAPYEMVLAPDFSLYRDWPRAVQIWNVYRNRWCGAFWQAHGFIVIPTLSWSSADSFDFCFLGVARHSVVAVSTVGVGLGGHRPDPLAAQLFRDGFRQMVARLAPSLVLSYGRLPADCAQLAQVVTYPTRWQGIRQARRQGVGGGGQTILWSEGRSG